VGSQYLTPEKHYGYAATWFSFAVIAGGFWVVLLRRYRKEKKST
jgi:cytochrome oxidase assembly protein ShyY1